MTCRLSAVCFDANDPLRLAAFWSGVLGRELAEDSEDGIDLLPGDVVGFRIRFLPTHETKAGQNQRHFDLTSTSPEDQQQTVARSLGLGARHIDIGQLPEQGHVVLADPEGNEFCVMKPDNPFLAGVGLLGVLACEGSEAVGHFWSKALGWPLLWDEDQQTAIQSPRGGPHFTWSGETVLPEAGKNQLHFDLAPEAHGDQHEEAERLVSLGATRTGIGQGEVSWVAMADPDGREFRVLTPR
jgi:catechol 2,3-dioxygenase-like lactoylglutathione lyase family enzyme